MDAYIRNHEDVKALERLVLDRRTELAYAEVAKNEITYTKKAALEHLVTLHGQKYFAGPVVPRNLEEELRKSQEVNAEMAGEMDRRRVEEDEPKRV